MDRTVTAAEYLFDLRRTKRPVAALPADVVPRSLAEGYEVQDRLVAKLRDQFGSHPIGYKIACTSELAQRALGVDGPFFGVLLTHSTFPDRATLRGSDFTVRCAEAEFGFEMAEDVPAGPVYAADTIATSSGRRSVDRDRGPPLPRLEDGRRASLLADNAIHGPGSRANPTRLARTSTSPATRSR